MTPDKDKGGRPRIGPAVLMHFPVEMIAAVDERAKKAGVSRSEWIRQAITEKLAKRP